jgi:hypothetical protein
VHIFGAPSIRWSTSKCMHRWAPRCGQWSIGIDLLFKDE